MCDKLYFQDKLNSRHRRTKNFCTIVLHLQFLFMYETLQVNEKKKIVIEKIARRERFTRMRIEFIVLNINHWRL